MTKRKENGYEAGKLASDIAYIKAGIVDLQEKSERFVEFRIDSEKRSEANTARISNVEAGLQTQSKRVDDVIKEARWTGGVSGAASVIAASLVAFFVGPQR